jgi:hypothetical protein
VKGILKINNRAEVELLKKRLLEDGYIRMGDFGNGEPPEITKLGRNFMELGGYEEEEKNRKIDLKIKEETLKKFHYYNWAIWIAIISLIKSLVSLFKNFNY